jgi:hypothetical protein
VISLPDAVNLVAAGGPVSVRRRAPERSGEIPGDQLSYARAVSDSPAAARQSRPILRIIAGYTIRWRNGLIAAM